MFLFPDSISTFTPSNYRKPKTNSMKKIYSLTIAFVLGLAGFVSASNPQTAVSASESATRADAALGARESSPSMFRKPIQSSNSFAGVGCIFTDNFDTINTVAGLESRGYLTYFRGTGGPGLAPIWFQGNPVVFDAYNGPANGYVASNFNNVTTINNIDNWLVLPALNVDSGDAVSFFSRAPLNSTRPDSLHVWYSAAGDSLPEDTTWVLLGEFLVNTMDVWEKSTFTIPDSSGNGRIAIRYAVVDGGPNGTNSNFIGIDQLDVYRPSMVDGQLFEITSPSSNCQLSATEAVTVVIKNTGSMNLSGFNVSYAIDTNAAVVETVSDTILPGGSLTYTFTATADLSVPGTYTFVISVIDTNDNNSCNDVQTITVTNIASSDPLATAYTMGFETGEDFSSWVIEDGDGDGTTWAPINTISHSGTMCMRRAGSGGTDDDWLFTTCLDLDSGASYTLDYWYYNFDLANGALLESTLNTDQNSLAVAQLLIQHPAPTDSINYVHGIAVFTPTTSGTYYIGFHAYNLTGTGTSSIRIDDINLDNGNSVGISKTALSNVKIYPNPNTGLFYLSSRTNVKNVTVEVYNMNGQRVHFSRLNNLYQQMVDLSDQTNGVYNIRIVADSYVENHSVVISR
jgi:hypothetical protein